MFYNFIHLPAYEDAHLDSGNAYILQFLFLFFLNLSIIAIHFKFRGKQSLHYFCHFKICQSSLHSHTDTYTLHIQSTDILNPVTLQ